MSSLQFALLNTTTIENLDRRTKVWTIAVRIPDNIQLPTPLPFYTITYPLGSMDPNQEKTATPRVAPSSTKTRTFAILHSKPGESPWDLGYWRNLKSVMGEHWYDWILPLRYSPCSDYDRYEAAFETGPVVQRMKEDAGLVPPSVRYQETPYERRHRRKRRRHHHKENDEKATKYDRRNGDGQGHGTEMRENISTDSAVA